MKVMIPIKRKKKLKLPPATCQFYLSVLEMNAEPKKEKRKQEQISAMCWSL